MYYYAHSMEERPEEEWQRLETHLLETSQLSEDFASQFGAGALGRACGLLHDRGKATSRFLARLRGNPARVDHSTAGGREAIRRYGEGLGTLLAYVVLGHHAGLPNGGSTAGTDGSLRQRLAIESEDPPQRLTDIENQLPKTLFYPFHDRATSPFSVAFLVRMLYSALVDADSLNTEQFCQPSQAALRGSSTSVEELAARLETWLLQRFPTPSEPMPKTKQAQIQQLRSEILWKCTEAAALPRGIYTLTVPTGGGKTFSSLSFALNHAACQGMRRVIYAIPFTSIIEQTAGQFKAALGEENVLEHHSNADFGRGEDEDDQALARMRLSAENWDAPVVVTTNVQFFESLFANRRSRCRKLHNIAGSVIILDEAQAFDPDYLKPCLAALEELVRHYGCTVVLCTATQPALDRYFSPDLQPRELMERPQELYEAFRKVSATLDGTLTMEDLAGRLRAQRQVLCIVNTRSNAAELYGHIRSSGDAYHLSARMTATHRTQKIGEIKATLAVGRSCRVVSTPLVEAGVDLDFPVVYRAMAGLDSIVQAAGRCNREGKLAGEGQTHVFSLLGQKLPGHFSVAAEHGQEIIEQFPDDPLSPAAVERYFQLHYALEASKLDKKDILKAFDEGGKALLFPFRTVAEAFRLIEDNAATVFVPHDKAGEELAAKLRAGFATRMDMRKLGRYGVQVYDNELRELIRTGSVTGVDGGYLLTDLSLYDREERGLLHVDEGGYRTENQIV